jgi:Uma2 family endonuclease
MSSVTKLMTAEELLEMPRGRFRYELIEGELKQIAPAGHDHGRIIMELAVPLGQYVKSAKLGKVYAAETGFKIKSNPDTVIAPDIAFIRQERVEAAGRAKGYWEGSPDLAVEVISPNDTVSEVEERVQAWLEAGTRQVWIISPRLRTVTIYRSLSDISALTEKDTLDGGEVMPGFRIPVIDIFAI